MEYTCHDNRKEIFDMKKFITSANPYMPLWEHVPDGEPRVFEHNGEKRVYVYGSHDIEKNCYCGRDQVCWSAPVDDLTDWTCHGVCYTATDGSILYAPDLVKKGDTYYMYAAERCGGQVMVATAKTPWGPFTNPVKTELGFDPGILVDDDGKVYAYWGFCGCYWAELNDDMATIKPETLVVNGIGHTEASWAKNDGAINKEEAFFEASSPRKVMGKYVYVYSKRTVDPRPDIGIDTPCNGFLSYMYSDKPLSGYVMGGDISYNGGEILDNGDGSFSSTYRWGNNHGGLAEINGQWYIFYHRQTGKDEFSRQAMLEPVDVALSKDGKLFIGDITYDKNGEPVSCKPVEMTSQGGNLNGIDAYSIISAGYTCHTAGCNYCETYIQPVYDKIDSVSAPLVNIPAGCTVGFRYLQFGKLSPLTVTMWAEAETDFAVNVRIDSHKGKTIGTIGFRAGESVSSATLDYGVVGKHAVYFEFLGSCPKFDRFTFDN